MRPKRKSGSTGEDSIRDEKRTGYVVDPRGKIRGEARNYDPYSRFGEIMLYDIDSFGFISGYVSKDWNVMSEEDLLVDRKLSRRLYEARYQVWMRQNAIELSVEYDKIFKNKGDFETFCRKIYNKTRDEKVSSS